MQKNVCAVNRPDLKKKSIYHYCVCLDSKSCVISLLSKIVYNKKVDLIFVDGNEDENLD